MPQTVSKSQFKAKAAEYLQLVEAGGGPLVITDRGVPKFEIRRHRADGPSGLESLRGSVLKFEWPTVPVADGQSRSALP